MSVDEQRPVLSEWGKARVVSYEPIPGCVFTTITYRPVAQPTTEEVGKPSREQELSD